jgi:hypothetical protein
MMETTLEKKLITILVNDKPVSFNTNMVTGAEIKTKAGVPPDYVLCELRGENRIPIGDNDQIKIHEHERFLATPGGVVS